MALNLNNPITENLTPNLLSGKDEDCYTKRVGYEILIGDEKYSLLPLASEEEAKLGEAVSIDSMGIMKRGTVTKILSGYEDNYIERSIIEETASHYKIFERRVNGNHSSHEQIYEVEKPLIH